MKWKLNELKFSWHLVALHLISEELHGAEYTGLGVGVALHGAEFTGLGDGVGSDNKGMGRGGI